METIDTLFAYKNSIKIIQEKNSYSYSIDSILLSFFLDLKKGVNEVIDLGSGAGTIPLVLSQLKDNMNIYGIEIQEKQVDRSIRSIELNNLRDRITILNHDIKDVKRLFKPSSFDLVVSNPPYYKLDESNLNNESMEKAISRHELKINLDELSQAASYLLKDGSSFSIVQSTDRFIETLETLRKYNLTPKRIRFIYPNKNKESYCFMIDARKNANIHGLKILNPLYIYDETNDYSKEVLEYFHFKENEKK